MDNSRRQEGKLVRWNEERGFGFIQSENRGKDIFLHISALKNMSRRPRIGDIIFYRLRVEKDGKLRAVDAKIQGVPIVLPIRVNTRKDNSSFPYIVIFLAVIGAAACFFYGKEMLQYTSKSSFQATAEEQGEITSTETASLSSTQQYHCEGKVHCSEMTSCEEALFYLQNCPWTKMDGDGDGNPCEDQWCGH